MLEKLVENWLDSASERSYQAPFCQMLAASGHTIVHSTRHAPTEFGKDVITVDESGTPWAFQLKGNPGSRLTKTQVAEIATQLEELAVYAIDHPSVPKKIHKCVLVTNGNVDEEALEAVNKINVSLRRRGHGANRIKVWTRGHLLKMATGLGSNLWPSETEELNTLLELLVADGKDLFPDRKLHSLLVRLLLLSETEKQRISKADLLRRVTSAALLVGIALRTFAEARNHFAALVAWVMFQSYVVAAINKHGYQLTGSARAAVALARQTTYDCLVSLCNDAIANPKVAPSVGTVIAPIHNARLTLIYGLMSVYWLWSEAQEWSVPDHKSFLEGWIPHSLAVGYIWGEGAFPQLLARHWFVAKNDPTSFSETQFGELLDFNIKCCLGKTGIALPGPYFTYEQVQRHHLRQFIPALDDPLAYESTKGSSFFAEGLLHIFVRANRKRECQALFPDFTRLVLRQFTPEEPWAFGLSRCKRGVETSSVPRNGRNWSDLQEEARDCRVLVAPKEFMQDEFLLLLFVMIFPYRATGEVVRFLDLKLGSVWMIPKPIV